MEMPEGLSWVFPEPFPIMVRGVTSFTPSAPLESQSPAVLQLLERKAEPLPVGTALSP